MSPLQQLPHDVNWPRAGDWPEAASLAGPIDLGLLGIPTHRTSLSPTGAQATPQAVRQALRRYSPFVIPRPAEPGGLLSPADDAGREEPDGLVCADFGDVAEPDGPDGRRGAQHAMAGAGARSRLVMALGGDNALTVPAALGSWGQGVGDAGLITLDAHHDLRDGISNGSPVRELLAAGLQPHRVVQIGIADFANSRAYNELARSLGITVVHRAELSERHLGEIVAEALDIAGSGGGAVHVDLDLDVCDRAVAPGCPASAPGGITAHELRQATRLLAMDKRVTSIDIAEVDATADDPDGRTVRLAALCVLEALAGLAARGG